MSVGPTSGAQLGAAQNWGPSKVHSDALSNSESWEDWDVEAPDFLIPCLGASFQADAQEVYMLAPWVPGIPCAHHHGRQRCSRSPAFVGRKWKCLPSCLHLSYSMKTRHHNGRHNASTQIIAHEWALRVLPKQGTCGMVTWTVGTTGHPAEF